MEDKSGTEPECSGWYFVDAEADCSDEGNDFEELFDHSDHSIIDDSLQEQGESLQLMNDLENERDAQQLAELKRKYLRSPLSKEVDENLSPRLDKIKLTPRKHKKAKKVLFEDSGLAGESFTESTPSTSGLQTSTPAVCHDSPPPEESPVQQEPPPQEVAVEDPTAATARDQVTTLLKSSNVRAALFSKCKVIIGVSFSEITRKFTSDRTMSEKWCMGIYGICEAMFVTVKPLLADHCDFICLKHYAHEQGQFMLALVHFKAQKCKSTIYRMLRTLMLVEPDQILLDPPRTRSTAIALFWYQIMTRNPEYTMGTTPDWIATQVLAGHVLDAEQQFDLSTMVQWAYDNDVLEDCMIAHGYAARAAEDSNAKAFLASNSQAKIVRDCAQMVRYYKRAELRMCSMSEWIFKRCSAVTPGEPSDWKQIVSFLRHQRVEFIDFLGSLKSLLSGGR